MHLRSVLAPVVALAGLLVSREASASGGQWFLGLEGYTGWLREAPSMQLHSDSAPRSLVGLSVPSNGNGLGFAGASADFGIADDKRVLRLLHLRFAQGFTSYSAPGSTEGTPISIASGSTSLFEMSIVPFDLLGFRVKLSDGWRFEALPDVGFGYAWSSVRVTGAPTGDASYTFDNWYAYVRADFNFCGKLGETSWMCASVQPNLAEFGSAFPSLAFNGGSIGLRVEL